MRRDRIIKRHLHHIRKTRSGLVRPQTRREGHDLRPTLDDIPPPRDAALDARFASGLEEAVFEVEAELLRTGFGPGAVHEEAVIERGGEEGGDAAVEGCCEGGGERGDEGCEEGGEEGEGGEEVRGEGEAVDSVFFGWGRDVPAAGGA